MSGFLLDSDILSVFAKVNALPLLCELLGCDRLLITTGVLTRSQFRWNTAMTSRVALWRRPTRC